MKKLFTISILLFSMSLLFTFCNQTEEQTETTTEEEMPFTLYESSEMALLMHAMEEQLKGMKATIKEGETPGFPNYWKGLFTAQLTKPEQGDDLFYKKSESFLFQTEEAIENMIGEKKHDLELYNLIVVGCVDCHRSHCPGPIARIEKLKWKDDR